MASFTKLRVLLVAFLCLNVVARELVSSPKEIKEDGGGGGDCEGINGGGNGAAGVADKTLKP
ncbi:Formate--tetrahydrofolate ligase [Corchorus capsularis]|uniref:Formate--tetrahydrofolate ligase n=1 Tax=Corchorus capsularis TaxID=210143 RepID=A0A1R3JKD4_COCAP|nr:Formate--tetrahydrofolate ligase [Corchorus capsularis]